MSTFRFRSSNARVDEGDVLHNIDTGNLWRIVTIRRVRTRRTDDPERPFTFACQTQRLEGRWGGIGHPRPASLTASDHVWSFERDRRR